MNHLERFARRVNFRQIPSKLAALTKSRRLRIMAAVAGVIFLATLGGCLYQIFWAPPGEFARDEIVRRVSRESPIFFADGKRQVGSLFTGAHRKYIPLRDIPPLALKAIVAAEDQNFYRHHGIDVLATAKAFAEGLISLNFRRAGSTITQQTVKILFDDWQHSFRRKLQEALAAFKMERLYSKDQILEFYLNQFHVTGNGNGIGVAARYYFDKDVKELDLVEIAFIAGTVKHPTKYNPFTKQSLDERDRAVEAAKTRKDYVLRRMEEEKFIDHATAEAAKERAVPFKRGDFQSGDVALVDLVRAQLDRPDILSAVGMEDAEEFNQAGLRIVTTLDADIQAAAETAVRRNLVRLEILLRGFEPEAASHFRTLTELKANEFAYGRVVGPSEDAPNGLEISFGGPSGSIAPASIHAVAALLAVASAKPADGHFKALLQQLKPGAVVLTRVITYDTATRRATLELARHPTVNGGLIVLDAGDVRATVPGFDSQGYDRALSAQRQPGSVFKAIVFHAALQLGWSILDTLSNARQVFPLAGKLYIPRGDHESDHDEVSMLWTGVESENIAAVWLTAHLFDKLSFDQFQGVLANLDLAPDPDESPDAYRKRMTRVLGVRLSEDEIDEHQLDVAVAEMGPDAIFDDGERSARRLRSLWWGRGYEPELAHLNAYARRAPHAAASEIETRRALIANNFIRLQSMAAAAHSDWINLGAAVQKYGAHVAFSQPSLNAMLRRFMLIQSGDRVDLAYAGDAASIPVVTPLPTRVLTEADVDRIFGSKVASFFGLGSKIDDVRLDAGIPIARVEKLKELVAKRAAQVRTGNDPMGVYRLFQSHDARVALALAYLVQFTRSMGVTSAVKPVLSFALGTNVVTLAEVGKIYQTLLDGKIYRFHADGLPNQLNFLSRIEDATGQVIYTPKKETEQLVASEPSRPFLEILRRVVTNGTGRALDKELTLAAAGGATLKVPVFGKTGTTNGFTSGSFAGFLPYPRDGASTLDPRSSYVIAAYAGFDRNQPMQRGHFRGYGAEVALPAWTELAKAIVQAKDYAAGLDALDLSALAAGEWPLSPKANTDTPVRVDLLRGSMAETSEETGTVVVKAPGEADGSKFAPKRSLHLFRAMRDSPEPETKAGG